MKKEMKKYNIIKVSVMQSDISADQFSSSKNKKRQHYA